MKEKQYIEINGLSVSRKLHSFINNELLPETKINIKDFWSGFSKSVHELAPKNKKLLAIRNKIQNFGKKGRFNEDGNIDYEYYALKLI